MSGLSELKNRGVRDMLIASVDGPSGFPDAIEAVFPKPQVQLCIVHMVRNSLRYVALKERREVARDLRAPGPDAGGGREGAGGVRVALGRALSDDLALLADELGESHALPRLLARYPESDVHDQRNRIDERPAAEHHQEARGVSRIRCRPEGALPSPS